MTPTDYILLAVGSALVIISLALIGMNIRKIFKKKKELVENAP